MKPKAIRNAAYFMIISATTYWVIQLPSFVYQFDGSDDEEAGDAERWFSLVALFCAIGFFCAYLYTEYTEQIAQDLSEKEVRVVQNVIRSGRVSLTAAVYSELKSSYKRSSAQSSPLQHVANESTCT